MWQNGDIPRELWRKILFLISKGNMATRGIGMLVSLWKAVEEIINTHLSESVRLHGVLYGFHAGRGMETAILELKIVQELARVYQYPLLLVLLDLQKAYATVDHGSLLNTLEGNGARPFM